jgi:hypothetical protein
MDLYLCKIRNSDDPRMVLLLPKEWVLPEEGSKGGDSEPALRESVWAPTGVDESVVQPAANEGTSPSLVAGSSFGGTKRRRGVGRWCFTPLFATESEPKRKKLAFKPRLRFVPRFLLAFPLRPPQVPYG